jgi:tripartite-type tricarboxylate transporter receptor subunit TctC
MAVLGGHVPFTTERTMEKVMQRVHASPQWRQFSGHMMYEERYMQSAEFGHYLETRRAEMVEFLTSVGLIQKK